MIRRALWLAAPAALGVLVAVNWPDVQRYMKIKRMSAGSAGRPEVVPIEGAKSYPQDAAHAEPDGVGEFDSARRGGPPNVAPGPKAPGEARRS